MRVGTELMPFIEFSHRRDNKHWIKVFFFPLALTVTLGHEYYTFITVQISNLVIFFMAINVINCLKFTVVEVAGPSKPAREFFRKKAGDEILIVSVTMPSDSVCPLVREEVMGIWETQLVSW